MKDFKIEFVIDNYTYSQEMIEAFEFERNKHVLQEMIYLGADVKDNGKSLSYGDINFLSKADAARINLNTKVALGTDRLLELYKDQIKQTDQMWKRIVENYKEAMAGDDSSLAANPEHYGHVFTDTVPSGFEGMGMYGGPNLMRIMFDPTVKIPITIDEDYLPFTIGYSQLGDGTDMHTLAAHYIRDTKDGIEMLLTVFFPQSAPKELVDGHKIHLASEFLGLVKAVAETL